MYKPITSITYDEFTQLFNEGQADYVLPPSGQLLIRRSVRAQAFYMKVDLVLASSAKLEKMFNLNASVLGDARLSDRAGRVIGLHISNADAVYMAISAYPNKPHWERQTLCLISGQKHHVIRDKDKTRAIIANMLQPS